MGRRHRQRGPVAHRGHAMTGGRAAPRPAEGPWYKRRAVLVAAGVAVVAAITVVTDLPQPASRASQISNDSSVITALNADIGPCSYALGESFMIYQDLTAQSLTRSEQGQVPGLLRDDAAACSFTDDSIFQLSEIDVPGTSSGKYVGQVVGTVTEWATSDSLATIEAIQKLDSNPSDASARQELATGATELSSDYAEAESELATADRILQAHLPALKLTRVPAGLDRT